MSISSKLNSTAELNNQDIENCEDRLVYTERHKSLRIHTQRSAF
jgi:hypothetical protein